MEHTNHPLDPRNEVEVAEVVEEQPNRLHIIEDLLDKAKEMIEQIEYAERRKDSYFESLHGYAGMNFATLNKKYTHNVEIMDMVIARLNQRLDRIINQL